MFINVVKQMTQRIKKTLKPRTASSITLGLKAFSSEPYELSDSLLCQHTLVVGPEHSGAMMLLEKIMSQQIARGGGVLVIDPRQSSQFVYILSRALKNARRLDALQRFEVEGESLLNTSVPRTKPLSIADIARNNLVSYVSAPFNQEPSVKKGVVQLLQELFTEMRRKITARDGSTSATVLPLMVVTPYLSLYDTQEFISLWMKARSANIALVCYQPSLKSMLGHDGWFFHYLMSNSRTTLFFKPSSKTSLEKEIHELNAELSPLYEMRMALRIGEALVVSRNQTEKINTSTEQLTT